MPLPGRPLSPPERCWGEGGGPARPTALPLPSRLLLHGVHGTLERGLQGLQLVHGFPQQEAGQELLHLRGGLVPLRGRGDDLSGTLSSAQGEQSCICKGLALK